MPHRPGVLISTLGSEPQVITLTIDNLLEKRVVLKKVIVLHTAPSQSVIGEALAAVTSEIEKHPPYRAIDVEFRQMMFGNEALADITTASQAQATLRVLYHEISQLKETGERVHVCPAGGRKAMAMYAMLVSQLLFDEDDRLWMLISSDALRRARHLHAAPGESSLLRVPVLPWRLSLTDKQAFVERVLTAAEAEVLELAARHGLTDREIAERRVTSRKTVSHQLSEIYEKLRTFLGYRDDIRVDRHTLASEFAAYFEVMEALGQHTTAPPPDI